MISAIVTSTYRYKRPPRKRKPRALDVPAIVTSVDPQESGCDHRPHTVRWPSLAALLLCGAAGTVTTGSQPPASLLPPDRDASANWRKAGMLAEGGIPNRTTVCATVTPRGGADDTSNIQNAIDHCPDGQVVKLAPGSFTVAEGSYVLLNKGITLRGAGAGTTILTRTGGAELGSYHPGSSPSPMILVGRMRWNNWAGGHTTLSTNVDAGSSSVKVADASGFAVGQIVMLDEVSGAGWQPDPLQRGQIWASDDKRVVWQKHNPPLSTDDFSANNYPYDSGSAGCWFSECDRPTNEMHQIASISGNTITFDSPVTISYRTSHQAQIYYWPDAQVVRKAGIENLTVQHGDDNNISFYMCANCWAKDVEDTLWLNVGININASFRVQLEGVYVHQGVWPVPGGGGYAIGLEHYTSEALIENSISMLANKVMVARSSGTGSVVAYNYMDDGLISGTEAWQETGVNASHMVGSHHTLFEGNLAFNGDSDDTHGNSIYHTFFRNHLTGYRAKFTNVLNNRIVDDVNDKPGGNRPLRAAGAMAYSYWMSYIGNVLGTQDHTKGWSYDGNVFMLGWDSQAGRTDPGVASTAIRNGNYDYLTNAIHWTADDTAHTLPNSLYLSRPPDFFAGYTWPWVDPIAGVTRTLPAKARFDAGTPIKSP
jgi:hypothetical protein